jgi:thiamine-monophosphate kinase
MRGALVRETGEFGLIAALEAALPPAVRGSSELTIGIGDDCAVWQPPSGHAVIVTTDSLVEGIHFRIGWTDWERLGHKSLAVNLSDIASMGAEPGLAVVTLALRGTERVSDLEALYAGIGALALETNTLIAGGDIVASPGTTSIHVTLLGTAPTGHVLTRSGAKPGDVIAVSGQLGSSAAGLRLLQAGGMNAKRRAPAAEMLIDVHLRPQPQLALGRILLESGASAAMDLSDGLFGDLPKLLKASGVRARLHSDAIPVSDEVRALFPDDWFSFATRGGEDYQLLFTAPSRLWHSIDAAARLLGTSVSRIGEILPLSDDAPSILLETDGVERPIRAGAFDHFSSHS